MSADSSPLDVDSFSATKARILRRNFTRKGGRGEVVRQTLAETIVDILSFSGVADDHLSALKRFNRRDWGNVLTWLHDAGLALYLLQKLKGANATEILPISILSRLEKNLTANRQRVAQMASQFDFLNQKFNGAGVRYVAVKGLSLVPEFCPDASLRHQSDFDYLVDEQSLPVARRVLEDVGYGLKKCTANEFIFLLPSAWAPLLSDEEQYEAYAPHTVELRLAFWDSHVHGVSWTEPRFSVNNIRAHRWQELVFRALPEEDIFLLQVIHAFNHILSGWVRMSWLYEIGYFLNHRSADALLWERVDRRIGDDRLLREMLVVVTQLSAHFFGAPLPSSSAIWREEIRPAIRIWIQHYARTWIFARNRVDQITLFSSAKVVLFLYQQYVLDERVRRHLIRTRLLPWEQFFRRVRSMTAESSPSSGGHRGQLERTAFRFIFHATAGLRYVCEIPRWEHLNKRTA